MSVSFCVFVGPEGPVRLPGFASDELEHEAAFSCGWPVGAEFDPVEQQWNYVRHTDHDDSTCSVFVSDWHDEVELRGVEKALAHSIQLELKRIQK